MALGERRCRILAAVVHDYVETAEPVGSETLANRHDFGVKPATIRNELAAMSEMGYLRQPHTSAGRVPSDLGYRYYVDALMPQPELEPLESDRARQSYDPYDTEIDIILQHTCRILAGLTQYTSLATPPQMEIVSIKQIALLSVGSGKLLLVTVLNTGHIDNRVLDYNLDINVVDIIALGNLLNERFNGIDLSRFSEKADPDVPVDLAKLGWLYKRVTGILRQVLAAVANDQVYVDGTANMLKQPEFSHGVKANAILELLEHRRKLYEVLNSTQRQVGVTVMIGAENGVEAMQECSIVASNYRVGSRICGSIGVMGPTRMDYFRAVASVRAIASNLSELLTTLSIE
jgi:heat-inducible transcriptional repressor